MSCSWLGLILSNAIWFVLLLKDLHTAGMLGPRRTELVALVFAIVVAGPAASIALVWLWREEILVSKREKHAITNEKYAGKSMNEVEGRQKPAQAKQTIKV